jgi:hypothetical protein
VDKVIFVTNVPQELALRFTQGKATESKFGAGMQAMYSTTDGRVFYVAEAAGRAIDEQLAALGTQSGEFITICKAEQEIGRGRKQIRWQVAPVSDAAELPSNPPPPAKRPVQTAAAQPADTYGERPDGTYAVPARKPIAMPSPVPEPVPVVAEAPQMPEWARVLLASTNAIVDVYASAVKHAARHEGLVKTETVQSILITALINLSKNSTLAVGK